MDIRKGAFSITYNAYKSQLANIIKFCEFPHCHFFNSKNFAKQVQCNYTDYFVCQSPLISTVNGTTLKIRGVPVPDLQSSAIQNWLPMDLSLPKSLQIQVTFLHMVAIRYIFTAWTVVQIVYRNQVSISLTFHKQLFHTKVSCKDFLLLL